MFVRYLEDQENPYPGAVTLKNQIPRVLKMNWQTKENSVDCGIFVMRHMETYSGNGMQGFNTEFKQKGREQDHQLIELRKRYVTKMLLSDLNDNKKEVENHVKNFDRIKGPQRKRIENIAFERIKKRVEMYLTGG